MEDYLPISFFREFFFCKRIPYFYFRNINNESKALFYKQGVEFQIEKIKNLKKRLIKNLNFPDGKLYYNKNVFSNNYKIYGICDLFIETTDNIYPVEIKILTKRVRKGHIFQVYAYGLCLEEMLNKTFNKGFLLYGKRAKIYYIERNKELDEEFKNIYNKILELICMNYLPSSSATIHQCAQCEFLNLCNDRNI
ncbi:MAG: hypothetical protein KatS3mg129_1143 [Leptospiraceae bacterium]|nr:MAG: hypothetical protein KatS3mg129_1143 [Leptospiraceae bacterium]